MDEFRSEEQVQSFGQAQLAVTFRGPTLPGSPTAKLAPQGRDAAAPSVAHSCSQSFESFTRYLNVIFRRRIIIIGHNLHQNAAGAKITYSC
jgi:hypothetical protein